MYPLGLPFDGDSGYRCGMRSTLRSFTGLPTLMLVLACNGGGGGGKTTGDTDTDTAGTGSTSGTGTTGTYTPTSTTDPTSSTTSATDSDSSTGTAGTTGPACPTPQPMDGTYGECNSEMWVCAGDGFCLQDTNETEFGVCSRGCADVCDCWPQPATGDASPKCDTELSQGSKGICVLDCSGGVSCPTGMMCESNNEIFVFPDASGGTSTSTGTGTSTSTSG